MSRMKFLLILTHRDYMIHDPYDMTPPPFFFSKSLLLLFYLNFFFFIVEKLRRRFCYSLLALYYMYNIYIYICMCAYVDVCVTYSILSKYHDYMNI